MDDLTQRPWWRWTTGMVVRVEGWGGRPVPCGVVVGSGEMARVADEWGTTPRIAELQAKGARVVPDLDSPATVGCLLERLREAARERTVTIELPEETGDGAMVYFVEADVLQALLWLVAEDFLRVTHRVYCRNGHVMSEGAGVPGTGRTWLCPACHHPSPDTRPRVVLDFTLTANDQSVEDSGKKKSESSYLDCGLVYARAQGTRGQAGRGVVRPQRDAAHQHRHRPYPRPRRRDGGGAMTPVDTASYIHTAYGVPADIGRRVTVNGDPGTIVGHSGPYLRVRFDGAGLSPYVANAHPTWRVVYGEMCDAADEGVTGVSP